MGYTMKRVSYTQLVIDVVNQRGCIERKVLVHELARMTSRSEREIESFISSDLRKLVDAGIIVRKARGIYCKA